MNLKQTVYVGCLALLTFNCPAHPGHEDGSGLLLAALESDTRSTISISSTNKVSIRIENAHRIIVANGVPDHTPGQFPNRGNPNSISAQSYTFRVTLNPKTNATPRDGRGAWFGVALNGVPFEPGTGEFWNGQREWNYEAKSGFINLGLDQNNAHVQPTGAYHYHGLPTGLMGKLGGDGKKMLLVGYAADGFPIYTSFGHSVATNAASPLQKMRSSWQLKKGERTGGPGGKPDGKFTTDYEYVADSGDLDECNGRFGMTPEYPQGIYHYYITEDFPQLTRQWRGTPDASFFKQRGGGPGGPNGNRRPQEGQRVPGAPPPRRL
ncbi:MAG: YHYH protein [Verrucomicrobiota bacterium]